MNKITTKNTVWGFFGTIQTNYSFSDTVSARLFDATGQMLAKKLKLPVEQIVCFLDSKYGRHFADELSFHGAADGMTDKAFVGVVRKFLVNADRKNWVLREARTQEIYTNERSV